MRELIPVIAALCLVGTGWGQETQSEIVVYGATSAGVAAAVQAKRMGKSVTIVGPDKHLGGMTASGLGWTDSGNKAVIGGISREFYQRVRKYYDDPKAWRWQRSDEYGRYRKGEDVQWTFEPHVAEKVFEDLVREYGIDVVRNEWLDRDSGAGVTKKDGVLTEIRMMSGRVFKGKMFIDATYEGDLMAAAGVSYTIGREPNSKYGETLNGVQIENAVKHQFVNPIDPYVIPGDPTSGILPRIHDKSPGVQGDGDHRIQAYNYRVCLTRVPENRVPFPRPDGYDPNQYELLLRTLKAGTNHFKGKFDMMPNLKSDTNNHGSFSTDNIGMNYDYPEASYERRAEILKEHETYQKGYFYFIANDPRVPEENRRWMSQWGLAKDEFLDNGHWPHQIYVREARRMVGDFVLNENHLVGNLEVSRSVGMGSYNMDSHNTQRYVDSSGYVRNEGDVQVSPGGPYPIDYGALIPKKRDCTNLMVPVCVSTSHIAYGSVRMEPVFMILGQSAATAATIALEKNCTVQDVPYEELRNRLLKDKQVLEYRDKKAHVVRVASLEGLVADDNRIPEKSEWQRSSAIGPYVEYGYRHDGNTRKGELKATFKTSALESSEYEVRISYSTNPNRASNVPVEVSHADGTKRLLLNQRKAPKLKGGFHSLGVFRFTKDKSFAVIISNKGTDGYVIIDAVQWLPSNSNTQ